MTETTPKLTPEQRNELTQKIWSLKNDMEAATKRLNDILATPMPKVVDGSDAIWTVYNVWNGEAYSELEEVIKGIRGED